MLIFHLSTFFQPNGAGFWPHTPNATAYAVLARAVGLKIRSVPEIATEMFVGPTTSGIDLPYMRTVFEHGLLDLFDAVSVHPYRSGGPETVLRDYDSMRALIRQYTSKTMPIISGEWGWSTCIAPCTPGVITV